MTTAQTAQDPATRISTLADHYRYATVLMTSEAVRPDERACLIRIRDRIEAKVADIRGEQTRDRATTSDGTHREGLPARASPSRHHNHGTPHLLRFAGDVTVAS